MACDLCRGLKTVNVQSETEVAECAIEVCALNGLGVHLKFNVLDNPVDTLWYFQGLLKFCPSCGDEL